MSGKVPIKIFFPRGIPKALEKNAQRTGYNEQVTALVLWQFQRQIIRKVLDGKRDKNNVSASLNASILKQIIRDKVGYVRHLQSLVDADILTTTKSYRVGYRSRVFSYASPYDSFGEQEPYMLTKPTVVNAFLRHKNQPNDPFFKARQSYLHRFDFDDKKALQWVEEQADDRFNNHVFMQFLISQIKNRFVFLSKDNHGREHHALLVLPKHIRRECITYNGERLEEIDLPAAQPMLLWVKVKDLASEQDVIAYREALRVGFYEYLIKQWKLIYAEDIPERDEMKQYLYGYLFSKGHIETRTSGLFRKCFPSIADILKNMKKKGHARVATDLQAMESEIIFSVCEQLIKEKLTPFFTVHDSIVVLPKHRNKCQQMLVEKLNLLGIDWVKQL